MDKVAFPYRSGSHLMLLHVVSESGSWAKHGMEVDYDRNISKEDAHKYVPTGEVEFIGGNHVSTYGARVRGDNWVYLGQTVNLHHAALAVRPDSGIESLADLRGKVVGTSGNHPGLNDWLFYKQHGLDVDRGDIELIKPKRGEVSVKADARPKLDPMIGHNTGKRPPLWQYVLDGTVDAALLPPPTNLFAEAAGLKCIAVDPLPMIWFTTVSSSLTFVEKHPDIVDRFLKGLIEGVHFFKTQPERSIKIIQERCTRDGQMNLAQATVMYHDLAGVLEPKLYPSMAAIGNVYEEAKRQDKDAHKINPMALWDLHHIRRIDDSGFVNNLYNAPRGQVEKSIDLEEVTEREKQRAEIIAAFKACGHAVDISCDCEN
jgi:ABC-type nitrate/sulfonate/bicarbonate transport system substrate-binding protein